MAIAKGEPNFSDPPTFRARLVPKLTDASKHRKAARESKRRRQRMTSGDCRAALKEGRVDREEILDLLSVQARDGHVPAMRLLLEEYRRDGNSDEKPRSAIDELAKRRESGRPLNG
jgi:hypothetical protein